MQLLFIALLDAQLSDDFGATVVGVVLAVLDRFLLFLVDAADIAHHVACYVFQRVVAEKAGLDVYARKAPALRRKARHFFIGQARTDGDGLKALGVLHQPPELAPVARSDFHHLRQGINGLFQVFHLGARELQRIGRVVAGQHNAVAVQNLPAIGHDGHHRRAVALCTLGKSVVAHHLQHKQAEHQNAEHEQHHHRHHQQTQAKAGEFMFAVADLKAVHGNGPSCTASQRTVTV